MQKLLLVGLGTIADAHLSALQHIDGVDVLGGVDIAPPPSLLFRGRDIPLYKSLGEAATAGHDPDVVVVATPTPTHASVCREAAETFPSAELLVEKPAADDHADATALLRSTDDGRGVNVAYHMAYSPEVLWGERLVRSMSAVLGRPITVKAVFSDPYESQIGSAAARFGSSWIDSGINALSVLSRFVEPVSRRSLRRLGAAAWSCYEGRFVCRSHTGNADLEATIATSWHVTAPSRSTRITYSSGAELVLDHHAVAGYLLQDGAVQEFFGSDGRVPRRESHYRNLYQTYLAERRPIMGKELSRRLHDLLLCPDGYPS